MPSLLLLVGGYFWLTGGRYVSTDNAYVQQDRVTITAEVSGRIVEVAVRENQRGRRPAICSSASTPSPTGSRSPAPTRRSPRARLQVEQLPRRLPAGGGRSSRPRPGRRRLQAEGLRPPAGPARQGRRVAGRLRQAENDLHAAEQALAQAEQHVAAALRRARRRSRRSRPTSIPTVLAALAKRDQAALDLAEHRRRRRRPTASSPRPTACRSASTSRRPRRC